ncbi:MAG: N-acetylmuramoyl-L-alanine amidase, partial [Thermodesulfobacteriota bacterium]|nr:N-acetylmuramoyl-L-alanine amidase [Thermodesulfobacteriota bacterium]
MSDKFKDLGLTILAEDVKKSKREINYIVVHCSATREGHYFDVFDIDKWHKDRGWSGCGYHYVLNLDGSISIGRDVDYVGAHVRGHNSDSIGICLIGGLDESRNPKENSFTEKQMLFLKELINELKKLYPGAKVV